MELKTYWLLQVTNTTVTVMRGIYQRGGTQIVWMDQLDKHGRPNISKYWNDGSYIETAESELEKISYYTGVFCN